MIHPREKIAMKSPQLANLGYGEDEVARHSDMKVMRSGGGWYVGSTYADPAGFEEPATRDSGYHATEADAALTLAAYEAGRQTDRPFP